METKNKEDDLYEFIADFEERIYANEERREDSLIQQAAHMQTAFSFVSAAVFMVAEIVIEHRSNLSLEFLLVSFSVICALLIASLFCATKAQTRYVREVFQDAKSFQETVENERQALSTKMRRCKYIADTYAKLHPSLRETNEKRVEWIDISMKLFQASLSACVLTFTIAGIILLENSL